MEVHKRKLMALTGVFGYMFEHWLEYSASGVDEPVIDLVRKIKIQI